LDNFVPTVNSPSVASISSVARTNDHRFCVHTYVKNRFILDRLTRWRSTRATKHLAQHLDLFFLVSDNSLLVSVDPTGKHQH